MAAKPLPSRELVRQLLAYDAKTGVFIWKPRADRSWNTQHAEKIAGTVRPAGHLAISCDGTQHRAHRLAWLYIHGEPVPAVIDHIDHDKLNNRINNLRAATKAQNAWNAVRLRRNTSGVKGIGLWHGYYRARIRHQGKVTTMYFKTLEEAAKARREAAAKLHGEFARHE